MNDFWPEIGSHLRFWAHWWKFFSLLISSGLFRAKLCVSVITKSWDTESPFSIFSWQPILKCPMRRSAFHNFPVNIADYYCLSSQLSEKNKGSLIYGRVVHTHGGPELVFLEFVFKISWYISTHITSQPTHFFGWGWGWWGGGGGVGVWLWWCGGGGGMGGGGCGLAFCHRVSISSI